jgi:hypothetical protein
VVGAAYSPNRLAASTDTGSGRPHGRGCGPSTASTSRDELW